MLERINVLLLSDQSFAFETTLATKTYKQKLIEAALNEFKVKLLFFWLPSIEMAIDRVAIRVSEGGHNIPSDIIARRYQRGIENLFKIYLPLCDSWMIFDNEEISKIIAEKVNGQKTKIFAEEKWNLISNF